MLTAKQRESIRSWATFLVLIGGGGFTIAMTLVSKASASDVAALSKRVTSVETHHDDDDKLIDWLVQAMWMKNPELPPPPARRIPRAP